jgi:hypothetical protein
MSQQQTVTFGRRGAPAPRIQAPAAPARRMAAAAEPALAAPPPALSYADLMGSDHVGAASSADEMDMMRYIGGNWPKYRDLWREMKGSSDLKISFSIAGFFLTTFWMLYRKLYAAAFLTFGAGMVFAFVAPKHAWLFNIAVCCVTGLYGKALVLQRAMKTVDNIKSMGLSNGEAALRFEKAGGTNLIAPLSIFGVLFFIGLIAGVAAVGKKAADRSPAGVARKV